MTFRKMHKVFPIALALFVGSSLAQIPSKSSADTVLVSPWVEPDNQLLVAPLMLVNQSYRVSITFKNTSASPWMPNDVSLRQTSPPTTWFDNQYGHPLSVEGNKIPLPRVVPQGDKITFTFQVRSPAERGHHELAWQLYDQSGPLLSAAVSRKVIVATLQDVMPPGPPPPIDARPFPPIPPSSLVKD